MNVARSTFVRRGYLLTVLTAAVLLAASSGTAWAQSASFSGASTLQEGADADDLSKPRPLTVTITRSSTGRNDPFNDTTSSGAHLTLGFEYNGAAVTSTNGGDSFTVTPTSGSTTDGTALDETSSASLTFADSTVTRDEDGDPSTGTDGKEVTVVESRIELTIEDDPDDNDWDAEELVLTLTPGPRFPNATFKRTFKVTIEDDDPQPKFRFSNSDIQLAKGNTQPVTISAGVGAGGASPLPGAATDTSSDETIRGRLLGLDAAGSEDILLSVEPMEAAGNIIVINDSTSTPIAPDAQGRFVVGTISAAVPTATSDGIELQIEAKAAPGFRDEQISLMLEDGRTAELKARDGGEIEDANPAAVTVLSGEATPTVTFSKASVSIMEGESETVHLLADTDQGDQVGSATVSVSGDARISLEQNGSAISGSTVSFGGSANAELTVVAVSDPDLEDGEESMATVTITDASGANIGDPRELTVTVVGATNVPVLPLVGQLLLALMLTVGGARLYRRRRG